MFWFGKRRRKESPAQRRAREYDEAVQDAVRSVLHSKKELNLQVGEGSLDTRVSGNRAQASVCVDHGDAWAMLRNGIMTGLADHYAKTHDSQVDVMGPQLDARGNARTSMGVRLDAYRHFDTVQDVQVFFEGEGARVRPDSVWLTLTQKR